MGNAPPDPHPPPSGAALPQCPPLPPLPRWPPSPHSPGTPTRALPGAAERGAPDAPLSLSEGEARSRRRAAAEPPTAARGRARSTAESLGSGARTEKIADPARSGRGGGPAPSSFLHLAVAHRRPQGGPRQRDACALRPRPRPCQAEGSESERAARRPPGEPKAQDEAKGPPGQRTPQGAPGAAGQQHSQEPLPEAVPLSWRDAQRGAWTDPRRPGQTCLLLRPGPSQGALRVGGGVLLLTVSMAGSPLSARLRCSSPPPPPQCSVTM